MGGSFSRGGDGRSAAIGWTSKDSLDWRRILAAAKAGGLQQYFIEQSWNLTVQGIAYPTTPKV